MLLFALYLSSLQFLLEQEGLGARWKTADGRIKRRKSSFYVDGGLLPAETNRVYLDAQDDTSVEEEEMGCESEEFILPLNSQPSVRDTAMFSHSDNLDTDPTVRCIQPAQTSPSCDQQLTNLDLRTPTCLRAL